MPASAGPAWVPCARGQGEIWGTWVGYGKVSSHVPVPHSVTMDLGWLACVVSQKHTVAQKAFTSVVYSDAVRIQWGALEDSCCS